VSVDPGRRALDREVVAWAEEPRPRRDPERFDRLARALFAHQLERCPAYARWCRARGATPESVTHWSRIPAVPTGAFKELALRSFPPEREVAAFRTSGTSAAGERRGTLHLDTLAVYEASAWSSLRRLLVPDLPDGARTTLRFLAPSPAELPDSSLSHMFGLLRARAGDPHSGFDVVGGELRARALREALEGAIREGRPVALLGTAFAFVHWLDRGEPALALPEGSRLMETGGFKGRSRTLERDALHAALERAFGVPRARIVNQYGMTELGSQLYDSVLVDPSGPRRKLAPPWVELRIVEPLSGEPVADGDTGMLVVHDLANTGSVAAVATADLARSVPAGDAAGSRAWGPGIEVLGRAPGAEARGCSIAADLMLAESG